VDGIVLHTTLIVHELLFVNIAPSIVIRK